LDQKKLSVPSASEDRKREKEAKGGEGEERGWEVCRAAVEQKNPSKEEREWSQLNTSSKRSKQRKKATKSREGGKKKGSEERKRSELRSLAN